MSPARRLTVVLASSWIVAAVVGCGGSGASGTAWRDREPLPADTMTVSLPEIGRHGGRFVIAQTTSPRTFNPIMANEQSSSDVNTLLWGSLIDYDYRTGGPRPALAKSWEMAPDSTTYTFHLRRGARFSDGVPITSADVIFSVAVAYDSLLHPSVQDLMVVDGRRAEFSAPDSYTVVMKLPHSYGLTLWALASLRVLPRHRMEEAFRSGSFGVQYAVSTRPESLVTSGAWRLKEFVPGEKTVLEPNPYWFRVDSRGQRLPYLDEMIFLIVPDQNTAALKFRAGEVDAVDNVKPEDYQGYRDREKAGDYTLYDVGPSLSSNYVWFNLNTVKESGKGRKAGEPYVGPVKYAWFDNRDFRRAFSKAIDRDAMIRGPYFGHAVKNWSTMTAAVPEWFSPALAGDDYDPEGAKQILARLGWRDRNGDSLLEDPHGNTIRFTLKTNGDNAVRRQLLSLIHDDLRKVGIDVVSAPQDFNSLMSNLRNDFQYDALLLGSGGGVPPDPGMSANIYRSSGLTHFWNVKQRRPGTPEEARMDALIDRIARSSDPATRHRAWDELQRVMNENDYFIWLPTQTIEVPVRNRFGNVHPQAIPHRVLWNIEEIFARRPARAS